MSSTTTWPVKPKRASRRRLSFTSPKMRVLLFPPTVPSAIIREFRSPALETKP